MIKSFTYRTLEDTAQSAEIWKLETVEFDSLNLLVGPSGVGKTRILRALLEVRQAALHGLDGVSSGVWELELELDGSVLCWWAKARTYLKSYLRRADEYEYFQEELTIDGKKLVERDQQSFLYKDSQLPQLDRSRSCIELLSSEPDLQPFLAALRPWRLHVGGPGGSSERLISVQSADSAVKRFNSNLAALRADAELDPFLKLLVLQRFHQQLFQSIVQDFQEIFTTVEEVKLGMVDEFDIVQSLGEAFEGDKIAVGIREAGVPTWILHPHFAAGMGKTLELLVETRLSTSGSVLMIDELENSLGVNCLPEIQRHLLGSSAQVLITSHHPKVINKIPFKDWKVVTRQGSVVKVLDAAEIPSLQSASPLEKFTQLLNAKEYEGGHRLNLYFLLEGEKTEKKVYQRWLSHGFPELTVAERIEDVVDGHIRLLSGDGYPQILTRMEEALAEMAHASFDHFFICLDAEDELASKLKGEVRSRLVELKAAVPATIVVQDCCIETWFLGNRVFVPAQPQSADLVAFRSFYDVRSHDPEQMPVRAPFETRPAFHQEYWKLVFREVLRGRSMRYRKDEPAEVGESHYFQQLVLRTDRTGHLGSFGELVAAWRNLGASIGQRDSPQESR